jgi:hypothetical protein
MIESHLEVGPFTPQELEASGMEEVHEEAQTQKLFQSWVARGIVLLILVLWLWSYFNS